MKLSQSSYLILGILSFHPRQSGYHIRKTVESSVGYFWSESFGQIYPALKLLLAEGLIREDGPQGPKRSQEYSLTEAGMKALQEWLALPFRDDPPRSEFLLKLFFAFDTDPQVAIEHLRDFQQRNRRLLSALTELEKLAPQHNGAHPGFPYWMLTLDLGLAQLRTSIAWSEKAIEKLSAS